MYLDGTGVVLRYIGVELEQIGVVTQWYRGSAGVYWGIVGVVLG